MFSRVPTSTKYSLVYYSLVHWYLRNRRPLKMAYPLNHFEHVWTIWVCLKMLCTPLYPMVNDQISLLNGYNWGYTPFSDIPMAWWSKRQSFRQSRGPRFTELPNVFSEEPLKKMLVEELLGAFRDCDVGSISSHFCEPQTKVPLGISILYSYCIWVICTFMIICVHHLHPSLFPTSI